MRIIIFPPSGYEGEKFWEPCENDWHKIHLELRKQLENEGYEIAVFPCDVDKKKDFSIVFEHQNSIPLTDKSLCIFLEPPVVKPRQYEVIGGLPYSRILTCCKPYCDEKYIYYSHFPIPSYDKPISVKKTKYICAISANKHFDHPDALYNARRMAYLSWGKDLDLYGHGWHNDIEVANTCNYLGIVSDKIQTLAKYKHALVFENQVIDGWVSEKYYHCIQAGTHALYRGAKDSVDYLKNVTEVPWAKRILEHVREII